LKLKLNKNIKDQNLHGLKRKNIENSSDDSEDLSIQFTDNDDNNKFKRNNILIDGKEDRITLD
jgi:hypothetical protein